MSKRVKVKLNSNGVRQLLKSPEMQKVLREHAGKMAGKTGGSVEVYTAQTRAVAEVGGDDGNNSALKAMGGYDD